MKTTGVILAGGLARRMNQQDKGLVCYHHRPLVSYAIDAITPVVNDVIINANRHIEQYQTFGLPVISDLTHDFSGPLAGILTALFNTDADILLVMPCDAPLMSSEQLKKLLIAHAASNADIAVATEKEKWHSVFLALKTDLKDSLELYLASGQRKVQTWLKQHQVVMVDFSEHPEIFTNINTLAELHLLENVNI
ncbi:molybdenum cofactor guanylyltransferase [Patescibacteria group bacterium]|nr:molybdenum cofactor guanylyltransferase [Patescibacteria group bacterium]